MHCKTLSVIALSNRDFESFEEKQREAVKWIAIAAERQTDLVVLPEFLNVHRGDGPGNPKAMSLAEAALDDWETATALLREAAIKHRLALTIPVLIRERGILRNVWFLISKTGEVLGSYTKMFPTPEEIQDGVICGTPKLIEWEGIQVGGAICFDTNFSEVFEGQVRAGAQLFLVPSLWPGGDWLAGYAARFSVPIALAYPAWSRIIDMTGRELVAGGYRGETLRFGYGIPVYTAIVNFDQMRIEDGISQEKLLAIEHRYGGRIRCTFDQNNCLYTLESVSDEVTVAEIATEFDFIHHRDSLWNGAKLAREAARKSGELSLK